MNNINPTVMNMIYAKLREENDKNREEHVKSGKLSASQLGNPTQWQVLSALKVESKEVDLYTLGKFKRGNEVEDFVVRTLEKEIYNTQVECSYRDCIGYLDTELYGEEFGVGYLPMEIKSVTNANFKWKLRSGEAQRNHKLQAGLYALALNQPKYSVLYVASDDYRVLHLIYDTKDIKDEVDMIIDLFNETMESETIPVYAPIETWQDMEKKDKKGFFVNHKYNNYLDWWRLTESQLKLKAQKLFKEYHK